MLDVTDYHARSRNGAGMFLGSFFLLGFEHDQPLQHIHITARNAPNRSLAVLIAPVQSFQFAATPYSQFLQSTSENRNCIRSIRNEKISEFKGFLKQFGRR